MKQAIKKCISLCNFQLLESQHSFRICHFTLLIYLLFDFASFVLVLFHTNLSQICYINTSEYKLRFPFKTSPLPCASQFCFLLIISFILLESKQYFIYSWIYLREIFFARVHLSNPSFCLSLNEKYIEDWNSRNCEFRSDDVNEITFLRKR